MPPVTANPVFQWLRIIAIPKHVEVMIEFEKQPVAIAIAVDDMWGNAPQVGENTPAHTAALEQVLAGFPGIMWHRHSLNFEIADTEVIACINPHGTGATINAARPRSAVGHVDRDIVITRENTHAGAVVTVFVGDQHSIKLVRIDTDELVGLQPLTGRISSRTGCTIVAVERDGELTMDFGASFTIQTGDAVYVCGTPEGFDRYYEYFPPRASG